MKRIDWDIRVNTRVNKIMDRLRKRKYNDTDIIEELIKDLKRSLRCEHMFRGLWKMILNSKICPWDMCLLSEKIKRDWGCPCKNGNIEKCWRRLKKELKR